MYIVSNTLRKRRANDFYIRCERLCCKTKLSNRPVFESLNPLKHNSSNCYMAYLTYHFQFLIAGHSWHSALSARVPGCQKLKMVGFRLGLHGNEHSKCSHLITVGFIGLKDRNVYSTATCLPVNCFSQWASFSLSFSDKSSSASYLSDTVIVIVAKLRDASRPANNSYVPPT